MSLPEMELNAEHPAQEKLRLWLRLYSTVAVVEREMRERLRDKYGMSLAKFDYLSQLYRKPDSAITMSQLGRRLMVSGGNITGMTDRLESDGLVKRETDRADRRVQKIMLTQRGRALFADMAEQHASWINELFADMPNEDVDAVLDALQRLKSSASRATDGDKDQQS